MSRCAAVALFLILAAVQAEAQVAVGSGRNVVSGLFVVPHSQLQDEFEIQLMNDTGEVLAGIQKRPQERYAFTGLGGGPYYVHVNVPGFKTLHQRVDFVSGSREVNVPIILESQPEVVTLRRMDLSGEDDAAIDVAEMAQPAAVLKDYAEVDKKLQAGKIDDARRHLEAMVIDAPDFYAAHKSLAMVYLEDRRYRESEREYQIARELRPLSAAPWIGLGSLYLKEIEAGAADLAQAAEKLKKASDALLRAIQLNPEAAFAHYLLGVTYYKCSLDDEAKNSLLRALELEPRLGTARLALANVHMRAQDWSKAMTQLNTYLKENPRAPDRDQIKAARSRIEEITRNGKHQVFALAPSLE